MKETNKEKKEFRKLTEEELQEVTGGGVKIEIAEAVVGGVGIGGVANGRENYQCTDGIWVRSAKDCPAMK